VLAQLKASKSQPTQLKFTSAIMQYGFNMLQCSAVSAAQHGFTDADARSNACCYCCCIATTTTTVCDAAGSTDC
jgi:hypothetical protein